MNVPGFPAVHRIITQQCRQNKGDAECIREVRDDIHAKLNSAMDGWPKQAVRIHVVVTIERVTAEGE